MSTPARKYHTQQTHYLRKLINFNDAAGASGVQIGVLPAGALIRSIDLFVTTAFDGTTPKVNIGKTGGASEFLANAALGTPGVSANTAAAATLRQAADQAVFATLVLSGASAGVLEVVITYFPDL